MSNNFYSIEEFLSTQNFKSYGENVRVILEKLMKIVNSEGIDFIVKLGKGKNEIINFSLSSKPSVNLCTIYIHKEHLRVKPVVGNEIKISDPEEIPGDRDLIFDFLDRYREVSRGKKQHSIYVYSDVMDKIEAIAKKDKRNVNEIIEQFLDEKTAGLFISVRHKAEFRSLLMQVNMFRDDLDYCEQEIYKRLAFSYLIAAYQGDYKRDEGSKFKISIDNKCLCLAGPIHLLKNQDIHSDSESILEFALFILKGSRPHRSNLQEILETMEEKPFKLAMNSLRILKGAYRVNVESENILIDNHMMIIEVGILG